MKKLIFSSSYSAAPFLIRISLGLVLLTHGAQKLLGAFGGYGFSGTMGFFTNTMGLPWLIAFLVIVIEFFGSISLILGLATRIWSSLMTLLFLGIVMTSHLQHGFFMNWFGNQQGEGFEYFILSIAMSVSLIITGSGLYSIDNKIISKPAMSKL